MTEIIAIIPVRYYSTRFHAKALADIDGVPMVIRCARNAEKALGIDKVVIAIDNHDMVDIVKKHGYRCCGTYTSHRNGTERVAEVAQVIDADIYLILQDNEPMLHYSSIHRLGYAKMQHMDRVACGMCKIGADEDVNDATMVKIQIEDGNTLLHASRKPISTEYKHVGMYAYTKPELEAYAGYVSSLERREGIEILRNLEIGQHVGMVEMHNSLSVDLPEHIARVEERLRADGQ